MTPTQPCRRSRAPRSLVRLAAAAALPLLSVAALSARAADGDAGVAASKPAAAAGAVSPNRVVVLPFKAVGDGSVPTAMSDGLSETLAADLGAGGSLMAVKSDAAPTDSAEAATFARERGAKYAVFGTTQSFGGQVRVTGQVVDAASGGTVGTIRAAGPANQFFDVQDLVVRQVAQAVGGPARSAAGPAASYARPAPTPTAAPPTRGGSYWAEYMDLYEPVAGGGGAPGGGYVPLNAPQPPIPPLYGAGRYNDGFYGGGGGYYDYTVGNGFPVATLPYPIALGTVRSQYFGQLGTSIIPSAGVQFGQLGTSIIPPSAAAAARPAPIQTSFTAPTGQRVYGLHTGAPISAYVNPNARFASPVGLPQRAAPPVFRPGAAPVVVPAAARASAVRTK